MFKRLLVFLLIAFIFNPLNSYAATINGTLPDNQFGLIINDGNVEAEVSIDQSGFFSCDLSPGIYYMELDRKDFLNQGSIIYLPNQDSITNIKLPVVYGNIVQDEIVNILDLAAMAEEYTINYDLFDMVKVAKNYGKTSENIVKAIEGQTEVHFIDVGQGDSIIITTPAGKNILLDGGPTTQGQTVVNHLNQLGINHIDAIVISHCHADHIGGLETVLNNFSVGYVFDTGFSTGTQTYNNLYSKIDNLGINVITTDRDSGFFIDPSIKLDFLHPPLPITNDANNNSLVFLLSHGEIDFLFEGDAELEAEETMLNSGLLKDVEILKVGHHGSSTSTSAGFLNATQPEEAIILVGLNNSYGHPSESTINSLNNAGANIYRADFAGDIIALSTGTSYIISVEPWTPEPPPPTSELAIIDINLNTEVVTIKNNSSTSANLTGWYLISEVGEQTFYFPSGYTLEPSDVVYITSGRNAVDSPPTYLKWSGSYIWNNDGDPGSLYDSLGNLISRYVP